MSALPQQRYTPEQYLEMDRKADQRSEYVSGEILALAAASRQHNRITINISFEDSSLDILLNPVVLMGVLSPFTESKDRGWKFAHYRRIETVKDYVLISQEEPLVEHYTRVEFAPKLILRENDADDYRA